MSVSLSDSLSQAIEDLIFTLRCPEFRSGATIITRNFLVETLHKLCVITITIIIKTAFTRVSLTKQSPYKFIEKFIQKINKMTLIIFVMTQYRLTATNNQITNR